MACASERRAYQGVEFQEGSSCSKDLIGRNYGEMCSAPVVIGCRCIINVREIA
jgi:hypothetical protein